MAKLPFLDTPDDHYAAHEAQWTLAEKRLYGDELVLDEITPFVQEPTASLDLRKRRARYANFPDMQCALVSGHIGRVLPMPQFNHPAMGDVRSRDQRVGQEPTLAEVIAYNIDGIGSDGQQFDAFVQGVTKRACATGYRWVMVEMPSLDDLVSIRVGMGRLPTDAGLDNPVVTDSEKLAGWRPFWEEWSPLQVPRAYYEKGVLQYAVVKTRLRQAAVVDNEGKPLPDAEGRYLLVRSGFQGLGPAFAKGGWWLFDAETHTIQSQGDWLLTRGQIPLVRAVAASSKGTAERPSVARSLTMSLGQIAIDLMNMRSEQGYNARAAAMAGAWLVNAGPEVQKEVIKQAGSVVTGVPPNLKQDGTYNDVTLQFGSAAALDAAVFSNMITEAIAEAREIMVRQVTQDAGESGEAKQVEHEAGASPLLAHVAGNTEQWVNTALAFTVMRAGVLGPTETPAAEVVLPRSFPLRDLVADVDKMLATLSTAGLSSPTWEAHLALSKGKDLGLLPAEIEETVKAEIEESAKIKRDRSAQQQAMLDQFLTGGGVPTPAPREEEPEPEPRPAPGGEDGDDGEPPGGGSTGA